MTFFPVVKILHFREFNFGIFVRTFSNFDKKNILRFSFDSDPLRLL